MSYNDFMFNYLEKLRQKTDREKRKVAFLFSFLFASLIFVVWFFAVFPQLKQQRNIDKKLEKIESSPTESVASVIMSSFGEIKDKVNEIKNLKSTFDSNIDYYKSATTSSPTSTTTLKTSVESTTTQEKLP